MENENDLGRAGEMLIKGEITEVELNNSLSEEVKEEKEEPTPSQ